MASACGAHGVGRSRPRCLVTRKARPKSACAAVAPSATTSSGRTDGELGLEPRATGGELARVRLCVQAALAARGGLPLEVLDRVGEVDLVAVEAGGGERLVEQAARGADERVALFVLLVAGLLADEHDARVTRALAEDGLRRVCGRGRSACSAAASARNIFKLGAIL